MNEIRADLADRIALALLEHGPMPCGRLARTVEARDVDVRRALRDSPRFECVGDGRGTRWRLNLETPRDGIWDGMGRIPSAGSDLADVRARLGALERRVAYLEQHFTHNEKEHAR